MFYLDETIHFFHPQENLWIMWITLWIDLTYYYKKGNFFKKPGVSCKI